ncbi:MAG TPA: DUF2950 domain-containing protein [Candidatus Angelobacter sp.]|nr:DUF2950 domain-containing protein [Candidatus Angelobacter sp.]
MSFSTRTCLTMALLALAASLVSCGKPEKATEKDGSQQRTFASPADAGSALFEAAKAGDENALVAIFGPEGKALLFSGDPVEDKNTRERFVAAYSQMHRWGKVNSGGQVLYVSAANAPFPIPLKQDAAGKWRFDTAAGKDEVLARRIGNGELTTIAVLSDLAAVQQEYFRRARQYAQKFFSDEGTQDGLYWPVAEGKPPSPLGSLAELAQVLGYSRSDKPQPFTGYYYRILTQQGDTAPGGARNYIANGRMTGGFAILAWPAQYRNSGIMTFIVGKDGVVYQKDLGQKTAELVPAIQEYNPGDGWSPASGKAPAAPPPGTKSAKK